MHPWHPDAVKLAAEASCDPRTAVRFLKRERIRTHRLRGRLEAARKRLGLKFVDDRIDERLEKAEALARLHGET